MYMYLCQVANELNGLTEIIYTQGVVAPVLAVLVATIGVTICKRTAGCYMISLLNCIAGTLAFVALGQTPPLLL